MGMSSTNSSTFCVRGTFFRTATAAVAQDGVVVSVSASRGPFGNARYTVLVDSNAAILAKERAEAAGSMGPTKVRRGDDRPGYVPALVNYPDGKIHTKGDLPTVVQTLTARDEFTRAALSVVEAVATLIRDRFKIVNVPLKPLNAGSQVSVPSPA
jgi:hypothetical protein